MRRGAGGRGADPRPGVSRRGCKCGILIQEIVDYAKQDHILGTYISVEQAALEVGKICNIYKSIDIDFTVLLTHIGFEEDLKLAKNLKKS